MRWLNRVIGSAARWAYGALFLPLWIEWDRRVFGIWHAAQIPGRVPTEYAVPALRRLGATVGERVLVKAGLRIENAAGSLANLRIGNNCHIGSDVMLDLTGQIDIGNDVAIAAKVVLLTHQSAGKRPLSAYYSDQIRSVVLHDGSMVGTGAIVLCGAHVGSCAWVGAGSLVNKEVPAWVVVAGNPARVVRKLTPGGAAPTEADHPAAATTPTLGTSQ